MERNEMREICLSKLISSVWWERNFNIERIALQRWSKDVCSLFAQTDTPNFETPRQVWEERERRDAKEQIHEGI